MLSMVVKAEEKDRQVTIEKATGKDFERVYPLLLDFNNPGISCEDWRQIFTRNWSSPENYCGYLLLANGEVKGFLGLLFSTRIINTRVEKFCNMTSWIVKEDFRSHSLRLLLEVLKLKHYTVTNFTPSKTASVILKKLGFVEIKTSQRILFPVPTAAAVRSKIKCVFDLEEIRKTLDQADRNIFDDHQGFDCRHVLILSGHDYCYMVLKNKGHRHLPFARMHYVSNRDLFIGAVDSVRTKISWRLKVAGLMVDERYVGGRMFRHSGSYPQQSVPFFKSGTLGDTDIDTLYSEMILLHN